VLSLRTLTIHVNFILSTVRESLESGIKSFLWPFIFSLCVRLKWCVWKHAGLSWHEFSIPQDFIEDACLNYPFGPLVSARLLIMQMKLEFFLLYHCQTNTMKEKTFLFYYTI